MAKLHQFNFAYQADEDRLLLRVNTHEGAEFRLWLTRRISRLLWELLARRLEAAPEVAAQASVEARRSVVAFKREAAVSRANFRKQYDGKAKVLPLGDAPVLIVRLRAATPSPGQHLIAFLPRHGKEISLTLSDDAIYSFLHLFAQVLKKTRWDLRVQLEDRSAYAPAPRQIM